MMTSTFYGEWVTELSPQTDMTRNTTPEGPALGDQPLIVASRTCYHLGVTDTKNRLFRLAARVEDCQSPNQSFCFPGI